MPSSSATLSQYIEKLLLHRGRRDVVCRVYPPASGMRSYSVLLEGNQLREQFSLDARQVEAFANTGNDQYVLMEIRTALRSLDKRRSQKHSARRP